MKYKYKTGGVDIFEKGDLWFDEISHQWNDVEEHWIGSKLITAWGKKRVRRPISEAQKTPRKKAKKVSVAAKRSHNSRFMPLPDGYVPVTNYTCSNCGHTGTMIYS